MASMRKGSGKAKPGAAKKSAPKPAARPLKKAAPKPAKAVKKPAAKPVKAAAAKKAPAATVVKPAGKPAPRAVAKVAIKAGVKPAPKTAGKPVKPGGKGGVAGRKGEPPVVRPLGVLPPESRARVPVRPVAPLTRPTVTPVRPPATPHDSSGAQRVTEHDMKGFEERLLGERAKAMKEMGHLEETVLKQNQRDSSGDLSGYSFHMADAGTDAYEREKAFLLASAEGRRLLEVDEALRRLYRGEYGVCESCGTPIAKARLEAMPYARLCLSCKEKEEKAGRAGPGQ